MSYATLYQAVKCTWLAKRDHIDLCDGVKHGPLRRPPEWFSEQRSRLGELEAVGREMALIASNEASFEAWKAGLKK